MTNSQVEKNVRLYYWYSIFNEPLFWAPILVMSMMKLGQMTLSEIFFMEAVVLLIYIILDMPSGVLADIFGRKRLVVIGRTLVVVDMFLFASMQNPQDVWIANIVWAVGASLQSGADTSLLYDSLKEVGRESEFKKVYGKSLGTRFLAGAFGCLVTGVLAEYSLRLPLYLSVAVLTIPLVLSAFFMEPSIKSEEKEPLSLQKLWQDLKVSIRKKEVLWILAFSSLAAFVLKAEFFTYNPYFELVNLPVEWYGVAFALLNVSAWLASHYAYRVEGWIGEERFVLGIVVILSVPLLLLGSVLSLYLLPLHLFSQVVRGATSPFVDEYMNRHVDSSVRASAMSVKSTAHNLANFLGLLLVSSLVNSTGLQASILLLGSFAITLGSGMYLLYKKL